MDLTSFIILLTVTFIASAVQSVCGFGFGMLVIMVFPYIMPSYSDAVALSGCISLVSNIVILLANRKYISFRHTLIPSVSNIALCFIAVRICGQADDTVLRISLGVILAVLSVYFFFLSERIKIKPTPLNGAIAGGISGILGGLYSMSGPPAALYFISAEDDNRSYIATLQMYFVITASVTIVIRAINGMMTPAVLTAWGPATLVMLGGTYVGAKIFAKLNASLLKKLVYAAMALSGITAIITSIVSSNNS